MESDLNIDIKSGVDLNHQEIAAIDAAKKREWNIAPMNSEQKGRSLFVLLKNKQDEIMAQGQLIPIDGIQFDGEIFNILGIGGIVSIIKGEGYGRKLMEVIRGYLTKQHKTGVGFTEIPDFYRRCGFLIDQTSINRFVNINDSQENGEIRTDFILYLDSTDQFMSKVLKNSNEKVLLPRDPNW